MNLNQIERIANEDLRRRSEAPTKEALMAELDFSAKNLEEALEEFDMQNQIDKVLNGEWVRSSLPIVE